MTKQFARFSVQLVMIFAFLIGGLPPAVRTAAQAAPVERSMASPAAPYAAYLPAVFRNGPIFPSAKQLIGQALQAGRIDYGTSLLYRAYAWFEDPRLPKAYWGTGPEEDTSLFAELLAPSSPLSPTVQAELQTFLARPDDPASVFNTQAQPVMTTPSPAGAQACDANNWTSQVSSQPGVKVKVHAQCVGNYAKDIQTVLAVVDAHYAEMVALMGNPVFDQGGAKGGNSDDIDFYLLDPLDTAPRTYMADLSVKADRHGLAPMDVPFIGYTSSGYALLRRPLLYTPFMEHAIVHEFFHILQYAHNREIFSHGGIEWWFGEATAVWAQAHFLKATALEHVHQPQYISGFRPFKRPLGLAADYSSKDQELLYAQYLWPYFMEQELGSDSIAQAWKNLEGVSDWNVGMAQISKVLPFNVHFHRFAVRGINARLDAGQISPRFKDLDPAQQFPDNLFPMTEAELLNLAPRQRIEPSLPFSTTLPSLRAGYYHYSFNNQVSKVELDLTQLTGLQVDAVIKPWNKPWELRQYNLARVNLCEISEMWLVISNPEMDYTKSAPVNFSLLPLNESCNCTAVAQALNNIKGFNVTLKADYSISGTHANTTVTTQNNLDIFSTQSTLTFTPTDTSAGYLWGEIDGAARINKVELLNGDFFHSIVGNARPVPYDRPNNNYSRIGLVFDLQNCRYNFNASLDIDATGTDYNGSTYPVRVTVMSLGSAWRPVDASLNLAGSGSFQAHSPEYIIQQIELTDGIEQPDVTLFYALGEEGMGAANISWSFTPVPK